MGSPLLRRGGTRPPAASLPRHGCLPYPPIRGVAIVAEWSHAIRRDHPAAGCSRAVRGRWPLLPPASRQAYAAVAGPPTVGGARLWCCWPVAAGPRAALGGKLVLRCSAALSGFRPLRRSGKEWLRPLASQGIPPLRRRGDSIGFPRPPS